MKNIKIDESRDRLLLVEGPDDEVALGCPPSHSWVSHLQFEDSGADSLHDISGEIALF